MRTDGTVSVAVALIFALGACSDDDSSGNNANLNNNQPGVCGNDVVEADEECDDGQANSDTLPNACRTSCRLAHCTDGVVDDNEVCDDGNRLDTDACTSECRDATCGDGHTHAGVEACDTEDPANQAECLDDCSQDMALCGNNAVDLGEACDLGNGNLDTPNAGCRTSCQLPACGDGITDDATPYLEDCDCGGDIMNLPAGCFTINLDGVANACRADCSGPRCGDGILDDDPIVGEAEACDEGGNNCDGAGCTCTTGCSLPGCGNGILEPHLGEECDCGSDPDPDQWPLGCNIENCNDDPFCDCNLACKIPDCGNGALDYGEDCDNGVANCDDSSACTCASTCRTPGCNNGAFEAYLGEECDEGAGNCNATGCGCSTWCTNVRCGDGHLEGDEECDAGDTLNCNDNVACQCSENCWNPGCGNGDQEPYLGESCDEGDGVNCDLAGCTCSTSCQKPWIVERAGVTNEPDLRAVWTDGDIAVAVGYFGTALHRDSGGTWTSESTGVTDHLRGLYAFGPTNILAVGDSNALLKWDGTAWADQRTTAGGWFPNVSGGPFDMTAISCWATPYYCFVTCEDGTILTLGDPPFTWVDPRDGTSSFMAVYHKCNPTCALLERQGRAFGANGIMAIFYYDATDPHWHDMGDPGGLLGLFGLNGVWLDGNGDHFVVGDAGRIHYHTTSGYTLQTTPTTLDLNGVDGVGTIVYAVGQQGTILRYDGVDWTGETAFVSEHLYGVSAATGPLTIAVGEDGVIVRRDE